MLLEVKTRSPESWGPLASMSEADFNQLINSRNVASTKERIKNYVKKQKKLKTYKIRFIKTWESDQFEIQAEDDWCINSAARVFFKENADSIGFKEKPRGKWADDYVGYDSISYVKVRS